MRRVYLDACIVIYLLEQVEVFSDAAMAHLARNPEAELCVSALVRLEVLAKPMRDGNLALASDYEDMPIRLTQEDTTISVEQCAICSPAGGGDGS